MARYRDHNNSSFDRVRNISIIQILILLSVAFPFATHAGTLHPERIYQETWCKEAKGQIEYRLDNGTRVDCLTKEYAVEVDFAHKWYEAIGQALYYAKKTDRKAGIVLIIEKEKDLEYQRRLEWTVEGMDIKVWHLTPEEL